MARPTDITADGQGRGNSGVFLMGLYEVQVLDNYDNPTYADGLAGGLYGQSHPSLMPAANQANGISMTSSGRPHVFLPVQVVSPARISVIHNGVAVQVHQPLLGPTQWKVAPGYVEHPATGPVKLQDHGDLVRFRNIWIRPL